MKAGKEGRESRDRAHRRPKETPIRESYRRGRTDHATWQILRRCESILLMVHNDKTTTNTATTTADQPSNNSPSSAREFDHNGTIGTNAIATTNAHVQNSIGDTQLLGRGVPNNDSPSSTGRNSQNRTTGIDPNVRASDLNNNGLHDESGIENQRFNSQNVTREDINRWLRRITILEEENNVMLRRMTTLEHLCNNQNHQEVINQMLGRISTLEHAQRQDNMQNNHAFSFVHQQLTRFDNETIGMSWVVQGMLQMFIRLLNNGGTPAHRATTQKTSTSQP